ncbi:hypothetical protein BDN67DRAFT_992812 [Paxillus ammoniavirescens]|nr:hypothetical protein BDN67DRAFT_992812 [Paxillus ammoniavirescens]
MSASQKRQNQYCWWSQDVIPTLLRPYMQYVHVTGSLSTVENVVVPPCVHSCACRQLQVTCLYFDRLEIMTLLVCPCHTALIQLVALRLFGCAPVLPSLAVDFHVLELVKALFVRMTLNLSGYKLATKDNLRRQFSTAYHWYLVLTITMAEHVADLVSCHTRSVNVEDRSVSDHEHVQPSEYLRVQCPLCFRGNDWRRSVSICCNNISYLRVCSVNVIVCIDACFTQKCSCNACDDVTQDPPNPTQTNFISKFDVKAMETHVEACCHANGTQKRSRVLAANGDGYENGMKIPMSVLDSCGDSFIAADKKREKASTHYFADTGLMAMLCRHDCVLWLVNMTSAGEKQHYALALIQRLFNHLPPDMSVGLLYDISCQLEQSCRKWDFFPEEIISCLTFAITVFHAYGHQWPCQAIYHPRKRVGFGLSDGEGCERLWSFLKPLIPVLRVSGFHQRLFVLDYQVCHLHAKSLACFGDWLHRRWLHCQKKMAVASEVLALLDIEESILRDQWAAQVAHQTAPLAHMVLALEKILEHQQIAVDDLEHQLITASVLRHKLMAMTTLVAMRCAALGVSGRANLAALKHNVYLQVCMNACAVKTCIWERLRQCKFELEWLEHAYHTTVNENKIQDHPTILKLVSNYNTLCKQLQTLIDVGTAPRGAVFPPCISHEGIFQLDVNDDIWQDIGLDDVTTDPPLWLADESVRMGIRHLLEYD